MRGEGNVVEPPEEFTDDQQRLDINKISFTHPQGSLLIAFDYTKSRGLYRTTFQNRVGEKLEDVEENSKTEPKDGVKEEEVYKKEILEKIYLNSIKVMHSYFMIIFEELKTLAPLTSSAIKI